MFLNDETLAVLAEQAVVQARNGADVIAPVPDMMDGRVAPRFARRSMPPAFPRRSDHVLCRKIRFGLLRPFRDAIGTNATLLGDNVPTRWIRATAARLCGRLLSTSTRAPTW